MLVEVLVEPNHDDPVAFVLKGASGLFIAVFSPRFVMHRAVNENAHAGSGPSFVVKVRLGGNARLWPVLSSIRQPVPMFIQKVEELFLQPSGGIYTSL